MVAVDAAGLVWEGGTEGCSCEKSPGGPDLSVRGPCAAVATE
jgi:hypothetical protein